eukprot:6179881-Pleurochrysis_carterae.AAC.3
MRGPARTELRTAWLRARAGACTYACARGCICMNVRVCVRARARVRLREARASGGESARASRAYLLASLHIDLPDSECLRHGARPRRRPQSRACMCVCRRARISAAVGADAESCAGEARLAFAPSSCMILVGLV